MKNVQNNRLTMEDKEMKEDQGRGEKKKTGVFNFSGKSESLG